MDSTETVKHLSDCIKQVEQGGGVMIVTDMMVFVAIYFLTMSAVAAKAVTPALERTIEATIYMSGVGAESGGLAAAHAIHNGMTAVHDLHGAMHGEKVAFGLVAQLVMEGVPSEELEEVIGIIKAVGLPLTLADLGLKEFKEAEWRQVAELSCAEGETIHNEPFKVTPDMVYDAIVAADQLLQQYKD